MKDISTAKNIVDFERIKAILLFVSVIIMIVMFIYNVRNNLFAKDDETRKIEREQEERRIERMEIIKNMK
ncbi:hypothetical protein [Bacillus cereus]|uniref:Uncharacterized protein n=1 Tax=Bacillus cereus (strain VD014) TaxID=1053223 RepID=A0A9W5K2C6_BACC8|nr:hypothetical protein [Bacillus cereus]EJR12436.1 hypothetical protein IIA_05629 [Bacillus cereus VD014]